MLSEFSSELPPAQDFFSFFFTMYSGQRDYRVGDTVTLRKGFWDSVSEVTTSLCVEIEKGKEVDKVIKVLLNFGWVGVPGEQVREKGRFIVAELEDRKVMYQQILNDEYTSTLKGLRSLAQLGAQHPEALSATTEVMVNGV